ncbi:MAG: hypothetical protein K2M79_07535 [Muribaculaceae bacterium]|nr:hypothetical protein [Muribaculaceae bacterium]
MIWQYMIVIAVVLLAVIMTVRHFQRPRRSCDDCDLAGSCHKKHKNCHTPNHP